MDNRKIDVTSEGLSGIKSALEIMWPSVCGGKVKEYTSKKFITKIKYFCRDKDGGHYTHHYTELVEDKDGIDTLILLWSKERESIQLPFPLGLTQTVDFIVGWLDNLNYGGQPDHDGDNGKGWRIFTESWGHVAGYSYTVVGVQPAWAMYGK